MKERKPEWIMVYINLNSQDIKVLVKDSKSEEDPRLVELLLPNDSAKSPMSSINDGDYCVTHSYCKIRISSKKILKIIKPYNGVNSFYYKYAEDKSFISIPHDEIFSINDILRINGYLNLNDYQSHEIKVVNH